MEEHFWHERWRKNDIGFHMDKPHDALSAYFDKLEVVEGDTVFVPLCGKSPDLVWLNSRRLEVVGVELSRLAIDAFVEENRLTGDWSTDTGMSCWRGENFRLFCGDFFQLAAEGLGPVDAAYDRGSLVALPDEMRKHYADHLAQLMPVGSRTLVISYEYNQDETFGPPFSVPLDDIMNLYSKSFKIDMLFERDSLSSHQGLAARGVKKLIEFAVLMKRI